MEESINDNLNCNIDGETFDMADLYSVKSEVKTLLTQILRNMKKINKLYQDKFENSQVAEVMSKVINEDYIRTVNKFSAIMEKKDLSNKVKDKNQFKMLEEEIMKQKENSELYLKRKKEIEEIKEKVFNKKTEMIDVISFLKDNEEIIETEPKLIEYQNYNIDVDAKTNGFIFNTQRKDNPGLNRIFIRCYICKKDLKEIHSFYPSLCQTCGDNNYKLRELKFDLTGRIAIVTGARVKIGYQTALKLLRANCRTIVTTRFPKDALFRYQKESEFNNFKHNLTIYPLDLRMFKSIDKFLFFIEQNFTHVDILINNAAQTVRRSANYYSYLLDIETKTLPEELDNIIIKTNDNNNLHIEESNFSDSLALLKDRSDICNKLSNLPDSVVFSQRDLISENKSIIDPNILGHDLQPIDFSTKTSWSLQLDEINFVEFAEVQLINSWAPFYLCKNLKKTFEKSPNPDRYIVNVTGAEGVFYSKKYTIHPHTNMGKASLNMMTHTSGPYYRKFGIYMNCVDTGWVSCMQEFGSLFADESQYNSADFEKLYTNIPLDDTDGAMRIIHPILEGILYKNYISGCLLKNYKVTDWQKN